MTKLYHLFLIHFEHGQLVAAWRDRSNPSNPNPFGGGGDLRQSSHDFSFAVEVTARFELVDILV